MIGLSEKEVGALRKRWGYNEDPSRKKEGVWGVILGDYLEGLVLSLSVFLIIGITFFQHKK